IHTTERNLKEHGDKVSTSDKAAIETALEELRAVKDSDDKDEIVKKSDAAVTASMKLGEAIYKAQAEADSASDAAAAGAGDSPEDDAVVDADFEEVDDDDKKDTA
ncbi:MAG: molecular chaperone DnaK, partial [Alphaproteobacteria bacterium]|nr:molecular chaperone DnaK [Alphaproteobacteria bacterium]